jgi:tetratricopeptide (TPR) repeat protein
MLSVVIISLSVKYYIDNTGPDARDRNAVKYYYRALEAEKNGDLNKSIEYAQKAISLRQDYPEAHNYLAKLYDKKGETEKALRELEIAVKINPVYAEAYSNLADISKKLNHTVNAGEYSEIAKQNFKLKEVLLMQAFEYYTNGQGSIAIDPLKKAINIDPEDAKLYYNLALVYLKSGFLDDSRKELKKALKIAEYKGQKEFVSLFSSVLSNLTSDDLVVDFIISNQPSYIINTPSLISTKPPLNSVTMTPVAVTTTVSRPTVSLPPPGEDPQVAAVDTMNMFFQSIDGKDYNQAYSLLSSGWQKDVSLNDFSSGFSSTSNFNVSSVRILETTDNAIKIKVYFTANKQGSKGSYLAAYQGVYLLVWTGQGWKIDAGAMEEKTLENQENTETF